jgi:two-component system, cell cycle sensor histidine kinase and response regulator CckA
MSLEKPNYEELEQMVEELKGEVHKRKQAEESVRESEEKYRALIETTNTGFVIIDLTGKVLDANDEYARLTGHERRDEILGRSIVEWTAAYDRERNAKAVEECIRQGFIRNLEIDYAGTQGQTIPIEGNGTLVSTSNGTHILALCHDISDRKKAEQQMLSLQTQLQQSQKMEAIGRLAGGVAHDFNNLLTVISVQAQLAFRGLKEGDPLKEKLKDIEQAADRAANLTRQLLAFSRRQILEMKVVNLNIVLKDMEKMLIRVIGEDLDLKTILAGDLGMVKVDPGQMEQVIVNLAVNAKDAMPKGGKLILETANAELDEEYPRSHIGMIPGAYVMLSITDTGIGMTKEVKEQIFDPFFTTKEKEKGTGLGLSTVYGIVKQSGGDIYVYSEPNQGTTFKVYLPRVFEPPEKIKKVTREEIFLGKETILIVEDDRMVRRLAVDILRRQGYRVLEATEGGEALVMCEKEKEAIDLILSDIVMPHMSGPELIERLKEVRTDFKVLYMTGYTDEAIVNHGILEEGINLIHKPFTIQKLSRKVREVLDKNENPLSDG